MAAFFKHRRKAPADLATEPIDTPVEKPKRRVFPRPEEKLSPSAALEYMLQGGIVLVGNPGCPGMLMRIHLSQSRLSAQVESRRVRTNCAGRWKMWHGRLELFVTYRELYKGGIPPTLGGTPQQDLDRMHARKRMRQRIDLERTAGWLFDVTVPTPSAARKKKKLEAKERENENIATDVNENSKENQ